MPGCRRGRRCVHHRLGRARLDFQSGEQRRVDLGAVEVGHHHPRRELRQLGGHADEDRLSRRPRSGRPSRRPRSALPGRRPRRSVRPLTPGKKPWRRVVQHPEAPRIEVPPKVPRRGLVVSLAVASPPGTEKLTATGSVSTWPRADRIIRRGTRLIAGAPTGRPRPGLVIVPIPSPARRTCSRPAPWVCTSAVMRAPCSRGRRPRL